MYQRSLAIADINVIIASKEKSILGEDLLVWLKKPTKNSRYNLSKDDVVSLKFCGKRQNAVARQC